MYLEILFWWPFFTFLFLQFWFICISCHAYNVSIQSFYPSIVNFKITDKNTKVEKQSSLKENNFVLTFFGDLVVLINFSVWIFYPSILVSKIICKNGKKTSLKCNNLILNLTSLLIDWKVLVYQLNTYFLLCDRNVINVWFFFCHLLL